MSARQAIAEVGFEEMLGHRNVYKGTDLHKGIIKAYTHSDTTKGKVAAEYINAARNSLRVELEAKSNGKKMKVEFMSFIRRVVLRAVIEVFIGQFFLDGWDEFNFIDEFMKFQDDLEDATAKSAVMPRMIALPLLLLPLKRRRLKLERIISRRLNDALPESGIGFWLAAVLDEGHDFDVIAQFIIGLLFAGENYIVLYLVLI